jgi:hypothetical protein
MPFLYDSFIHNSTPVAPKTMAESPCLSRAVCVTQHLNRDAEASQAPEVMMCATLSSPLLRRSVGTTKWYTLLQHEVEDDQHLVRYGHYGAFLTSPRDSF